MQRQMVMAGLLGLLMLGAGCTDPNGITGPVGPQGPQGPDGAGYKEIIFRPAAGDTKGKDNLIYSIGGNVGTQPLLAVGYASGASAVGRTLMYFDVAQAGVPAGATIVDAILVLYPEGTGTPGNFLSASVYPLTRLWDETGSTWNSATNIINWTTPGGDYDANQKLGSFLIELGTTAPVTIHLSPTFIAGWLNGQVNHGIVIRANTETAPQSEVAFYSRDYATDTNKRPYLKIIYKERTSGDDSDVHYLGL
jgi:hypothetical protein